LGKTSVFNFLITRNLIIQKEITRW